MMQNPITKAEVLITRECNLSCSSCGLIHDRVPDMEPEQWARVWKIVYEKLGASFIAIYGGEPLVYGIDRLVQVVRDLSRYRRKDRDFTIISNGLGLTDEYADRLAAAGLQSWTSTVDTVLAHRRDHMDYKTAAGHRALDKFRKRGIRDTCGIVTVTARNLGEVIPTIDALCSQGSWVGLDLIHHQRGDGEYSFSSDAEHMPDLVLTREHLPQLQRVAEKILGAYEDLLVFPTKRVLEMWKQAEYAVDLSWKCTPGHAVTIDADGSLGLCDDRLPQKMGPARKKALQRPQPWSVFDLEEASEALWEEFLSWYGRDLAHCEGCFWSTHVMAVDARHDPNLREHYVHNRKPHEL